MIFVGLIICGVANYWMSQTNLEISPFEVIWPRVMMIAGLGLLFAGERGGLHVHAQGMARGGGRAIQPAA